MKKTITASLVALATATGFLVNHQPVQARARHYYHYPLHRNYPFYRDSINYCYPVTNWTVDQDPGYHPQAYADGYRQGQESARKGNTYKQRTAGGEFARGFDEGYYKREFSGQKHIVPNEYKPYTTSECGWY